MSKLMYTTLFLLLIPFYSLASSNQVMLQMIAYITSNSDYSYNNEKLPFIEIRTTDELCRAVYSPDLYETIKDQCTVSGYYNENLNTIFIADESGPNMVEERFLETVLFHELVHFLQYINGSYETAECPNALEKDAYLLQDQFVQDMNYPEEQRPDKFFAMIVSTCFHGNFAP